MVLLRTLLALSVPLMASSSEQAANPIRKVVNMLQEMQKKVTEEGEKEEAMYKKFMCYCRSSGGDLEASIAAANTKIPAVQSDIEAAVAEKAQKDEEVKQEQADREDAKKAMADASAIRDKEKAAYDKEKGDLDMNIAAIEKAVAALEKGAYGTFLQTNAASVLRKLVTTLQSIADEDRSQLLAFLSEGQSSDYAPQSGQIIGILKELGDEMSKDRDQVVGEEQTAIKEHEELMAAKKKEVLALTASIESKMSRSAELGVSIAGMKNDLSDTEAALIQDKKFAEDLKTDCDTKTSEWEEITKTRNEELLAIAETIKLLNDDDALDLFKKTLSSPAASFVQVSGADDAKTRAMALLRQAAKKGGNPALDFITLALKGKKIGFEKVIAMVDEMVETLKQEQVDDDNKKEYCEKHIDVTEDKQKALERSAADTDTAIANAEEGIKTTADEIEALESSIKKLDKETAEATEQRKEEHELFTDLMQSNTQAKDLLELARNRLHKFYNPKMYTTTTPPRLARGDEIYKAYGGEVFAQLSAVRRHGAGAAPPPAPEAPGPYNKKSEESTGVIGMIDLLIKELVTEMTEAQTNEKNAQTSYSQLMQDSAESRAASSKSLTEKEIIKADLESELQSHKEAKASTMKEMAATAEYMGNLHGECDWLLQYFDARKEARTSEIDALGQAKAVLKGADYSFAQKAVGRNLRSTVRRA